MPTAVYRLYANFEPKLVPGEASDRAAAAVAEIGAAVSTKLLETAVNRQSRLASRITIEKKAPEPASRPPLLKDAIKVVDLRLRVGRRAFEAWNFATVHRQLAEAESALAGDLKLLLDEELRQRGVLNGARVDVAAELIGSGGFFGGGGFWRLFWVVLGALLGAAGLAAAGHHGFDLPGAIGQIVAQLPA